MANNYDQATVQPDFPASSVSGLASIFLDVYGFSSEIHSSDKGDTVYFFVEDGTRDEIEDVTVELVSEHAAKGDPIAVKLLEYIQGHGSDELDSYVCREFHWQYIFQEILKKPECKGIEDICIEGPYTRCSSFFKLLILN